MQRMPYLIYMQELQISLTNFNDILQKIDNYVTNPTTTKISWKSKLLKTIDKKSLCYSDTNFLVLLRISVTQKKQYFSLLIFEAKNGIRQEK